MAAKTSKSVEETLLFSVAACAIWWPVLAKDFIVNEAIKVFDRWSGRRKAKAEVIANEEFDVIESVVEVRFDETYEYAKLR